MTMSNVPVYFRLDHAGFIGEGHLFRSKALAFKMKEAGFNPIFVTRPNFGFDSSRFLPFEVITLKKVFEDNFRPADYLEWLGVSESGDVKECLASTGHQKDCIWVVDHYGIGVKWEEEMSLQNQFIVVIDDLFRTHFADVVIDHNLTADSLMYKNKKNDPVYLMGPKYALLRDDICQAPQYEFSNDKKSSLLFLGSVEESLFYKFIMALREFNLEHLTILNPPSNFNALSSEKILPFCNNLPELYSEQKMVFGSCGVAHLERMALGVPSVTCVIVDNQIDVGLKTKELQISHHLGDLRTLSIKDLGNSLKEVIKNPEILEEKALAGKKIISLDGTKLITEAIEKKFKEWQSH